MNIRMLIHIDKYVNLKLVNNMCWYIKARTTVLYKDSYSTSI